jgi:hypothetical protein
MKVNYCLHSNGTATELPSGAYRVYCPDCGLTGFLADGGAAVVLGWINEKERQVRDINTTRTRDI